MKRLLVCAAALASCLPAASSAENLPLPPDIAGWYVRTRAIAGLSHADGSFSRAPRGAFESDMVSADPQADFGAGVGLGYRWTSWGVPLRAVVDGSLNFRHDTDVEARFPGGARAYENNLRIWDIRASLLADVLKADWGTVYVGGGLGAARLESEVEIEASPEVTERSEWKLSPSVEIGLLLDGVFERVIPELSYRFRWFGDTESATFPGGGKLEYTNVHIHDFMLGFTMPLGPDADRESSPLMTSSSAAYDWTGFHVGAFGGWAWSDSIEATELADTRTFGTPDSGVSFSEDGLFAGASIGVDRQWRHLVIGLGAEGGILDLEGSAGASEVASGGAVRFDTGGYAGVTARLGLAFDRLLVFARGGVAFLDAEARALGECRPRSCGAGSFKAQEDDVLFGESIGGGAEYAFGEHWSLGAEYRFIHLFDDLQPSGGAGGNRRVWENVGIDDIHTVRGQVSYRW